MTNKEISDNILDLTASIGRAGLHAIAPDDFEYYLCTFELRNSEMEVVDWMNFTVMPNQISVNRTSLVNIKRSQSAMLSLFSDTFPNYDINLSGTFGRKFRLISAVTEKGLLGKVPVKVKTGYGAMKLMEKMIEKSQQTDADKKPYLLFFYNYSLNQQFLVEVMNFNPTMSMENNMMWNYSMTLKGLANAGDIIQNIGGTVKYIIGSADNHKLTFKEDIKNRPLSAN